MIRTWKWTALAFAGAFALALGLSSVDAQPMGGGGASSRNVSPVPVSIDPATCLSVSYTAAGDGGLLCVPPGKRLRLMATSDLCLSAASAVPACSLTVVSTVASLRLTGFAPEEATFTHTTAAPNTGVTDAGLDGGPQGSDGGCLYVTGVSPGVLQACVLAPQ